LHLSQQERTFYTLTYPCQPTLTPLLSLFLILPPLGIAMNLRVDFYLLPVQTTEESLKYACILTEKAYLAGHKTFMWAPSSEVTENLNRTLWTFRDVSFIPHGTLQNGDSTLPVLIGFQNPPLSGEILINMTLEVPSFFKGFQRIIELVSDQPEAVLNSRKKYRIYRENGCELFSHDLKKTT
jgi:DNA polymerase III subunit chi